MKLKISHTTVYTYDQPVPFALQQLRQSPRSEAGQSVLNWSLSVVGGSKELWFNDQFNNITNLISMDQGSDRIEVICAGEVETTDQSGIVGRHRGYAPLWLFESPTPNTAPGPALRKLAQTVKAGGTRTSLEKMHELSALIGADVAYETGRTTSATSAEAALSAGHGVCQDHAQIMIAVARLLGYPARYVSGYLMMNDRVDQDASHAWCEIWIDQLGWVGFDVSNGIAPDERYVRVAIGRDFTDASPARGIRRGRAKEGLCVSLQVQQ